MTTKRTAARTATSTTAPATSTHQRQHHDTTATTGATVTTGPEGFAAGTGKLTTSDGIDAAITVHTCTNTGETDLAFDGDGPDAGRLTVNAENGQKSITWTSSTDQREGTIDTVQVGDTGNFRVTGKLSIADDSAQPATFILVGTCPTLGSTTTSPTTAGATTTAPA